MRLKPARRKARQLAADQVRRCRRAARRGHSGRSAGIGEVGPDDRGGRGGRRRRRASEGRRAGTPTGRLPASAKAGHAKRLGFHRALPRDPADGRRLPARNGCTRSSSTAIACRRSSTGGKVKLLTRTGLDWTGEVRHGASPRRLPALDCEDAIIDGEVVVLADKRRLLLRRAAGGAVGRPDGAHRLLCLRPAASRRRGSAQRAAGRAQGRRWRSCSASNGEFGRCASASISPNPGRPCCSMPAGWGWKASFRSAPTRPIAAAAASTGSSRNARCGRNSSSSAICRRQDRPRPALAGRRLSRRRRAALCRPCRHRFHRQGRPRI